MIETKSLVAFINSCIVNSPDFAREHYHEIVARLKELDDLKARLSDIKFPIFGEENDE